MTLDETHAMILKTARSGGMVARVHTGDPSLYGAIKEQMILLDQDGISYEVIPGVTAAFAAAAAARVSFTLPEKTQSLIFTRIEGRTPVPEKESLKELARSNSSMAIYLSSTNPKAVEKGLIEGGYPEDTPVVIGYRIGWPDQRLITTSISLLARDVKQAGINKQAVFLILPGQQDDPIFSRLYSRDFSHGFRQRMRSNRYPEIGERQAPGPKDQRPECYHGCGYGKLTIVSLGPGDPRYLAPKARTALMRAEVIVGYKTYIDLIESELLVGKEIISTGMMKEIIRSQTAIDRACQGKDTAVVSSGDAGIYGMAGLVLELLAEQGLIGDVKVEVIPGISALSAAAALLGAPLMHDFAVISLSDLMIPWEVIRQRVEAAVKADFVLVIYNPKSKKRNWQLEEVRELIRKYRGDHMPVGIVRNAMRQGQSVEITTLSHLDVKGVDMLSILVVGNSRTRLIEGKMVTSRGYMEMYGIENLQEGVNRIGRN